MSDALSIEQVNRAVLDMDAATQEDATLVQQASNNTKEQFANSPDLANGILNAIMDAFAAHSEMSKQALDSERVREGLKEVLLGPAQLYEALRDKAGQQAEAWRPIERFKSTSRGGD